MEDQSCPYFWETELSIWQFEMDLVRTNEGSLAKVWPNSIVICDAKGGGSAGGRDVAIYVRAWCRDRAATRAWEK